jgi:hypothetical protein
MAGVKTERTTAGHKTPPKRPKDWVAPTKVVRAKGNPAVRSVVTGSIPGIIPGSDDTKKAVADYDAACKALAGCRPNDRGAENKRHVAYQRLVQLGLRPQVRGRYRAS